MKKGLVRHFLSRKGQKLESAGFTLIELLIVIGILAILVVTVLIALNPAEANKKTRDVKRIKDIHTLQAIVLQYVNGGGDPICPNGCSSGTAGAVKSQSCSSNWMKVDLCKYTNSVPTDPLNSQSVWGLGGGGTIQNPDLYLFSAGGCGATYTLRMIGSDYKLCAMQESKSSASNTFGDGGTNNGWYEAGSKLDMSTNTCGC